LEQESHQGGLFVVSLKSAVSTVALCLLLIYGTFEQQRHFLQGVRGVGCPYSKLNFKIPGVLRSAIGEGLDWRSDLRLPLVLLDDLDDYGKPSRVAQTLGRVDRKIEMPYLNEAQFQSQTNE
jgi:hypothetical protein